MKLRKPQKRDVLFFAIIVLLIIPQTRKPIQVTLNKVLALFAPSVIDKENRSVFELSNWKLEDLNGEQINLKDLKGEVILLNFWATWCPPCIAELPHIQKLTDDYGEKIKIVLVSNESLIEVASYLRDKGYSLNSYRPISNYPNNLDISSIPRTFLIDRQGNIVIDKTGAANWNGAKVREVIDELLK